MLGTATLIGGTQDVAQLAAYLPTDGSYTIAIEFASAAAVRLQASILASDAQPRAITLPFDGVAALLPNATADFTLSGTASKSAHVVLTQLEGSLISGTTPGQQAQVRLLQGGTVLGTADVGGSTTDLLVRLPADGNYTVEVVGNAGAVFELTVGLEGDIQSEALSIPADITRDIAALGVYRGALTLSTPTSVYFDARRTGGDLTDVKLIAADGTVLFDAPPNPQENELTNSITVTLPAGSYTVQVTPQTGAAASERMTLATTSWVPIAPTLEANGSQPDNRSSDGSAG